MNITDYCDILNINIKITYYHNQNKRWSASFEYGGIKESAGIGILKSEYGTGKTPELAMIDYLYQVRGKYLVINAMGGDKIREVIIPMNLVVE